MRILFPAPLLVRDFVCNTLSLRKEVVVSLNKINMVDINAWLDEFLQKLNEVFKCRVWFVGLQGSYGRGEATETSDIDVVVILNEFTVADIQAYNQLLDTLPHRELICGFVSGKDEIIPIAISKSVP